MTSPTKPSARGRPRSAEAEAAVLKAAEALMEELRPSQITADNISARSGVSKATLYKWWPSKTHILLSVVLGRAEQAIPMPDTGSAIEDFIHLLNGFVRFYKHSSFGTTVAHLLAEGLNDPEIMRHFNARYTLPRRAMVRTIWDRGVARGEISPDFDPELGLDLLYGPPTYRYWLGHAEVDDNFAERTVRAVFEGARHR